MKRIGVAFTKPRGDNQRRNEYGIYESDPKPYGIEVPVTLHVKYEGYRYQREDGEVQVGLPFAGPNAVHTQQFAPFYPKDFETVRRFDGQP